MLWLPDAFRWGYLLLAVQHPSETLRGRKFLEFDEALPQRDTIASRKSKPFGSQRQMVNSMYTENVAIISGQSI